MVAQSQASSSGSPIERSPSIIQYLDGTSEAQADVRLQFRYYTRSFVEWDMVGVVASISFMLDAPVAKTWPYFKDFNLWHYTGNYFYSGVVGDLEGRTFRLSKVPNEAGPHQYRVLRVIPEHLIEWDQPPSWMGGAQPYDGYGAYMLNEYGQRTLATVLMTHAHRTADQTTVEILEFWRGAVAAALVNWRDAFIPTLKKAVMGSS